MTRILRKIKDSSKDLDSINLNFDRISLDLSDRSGIFSSVVDVPGGITLNPFGTVEVVEVNVVDELKIYTKNELPVIPRVRIYVNNDLDDTYLWPSGSNLLSTQVYDISVTTLVAQQVFNPIENEDATYFIILKNSGIPTYTIYVHTDTYYVPGPDLGVTRRTV